MGQHQSSKDTLGRGLCAWVFSQSHGNSPSCRLGGQRIRRQSFLYTLEWPWPAWRSPWSSFCSRLVGRHGGGCSHRTNFGRESFGHQLFHWLNTLNLAGDFTLCQFCSGACVYLPQFWSQRQTFRAAQWSLGETNCHGDHRSRIEVSRTQHSRISCMDKKLSYKRFIPHDGIGKESAGKRRSAI